MTDYVSKNEVKPYRELFSEMIENIREEVREEGITFTYVLVGSAKRNLVVRHHNKGFDCDYQIFIQSNENGLKPKQIKFLFINLFNANKPHGFKDCEDSTSAITMKKVLNKESKILFSYDIVILEEFDDLKIIRKSGEDTYVWNQLKDMSDRTEVLNQIQGANMWNDLREIYYNKRIDAINGKKGFKDKKSFQLLHEAAKEVLDMYE